jgi:hypothetical protein
MTAFRVGVCLNRDDDVAIRMGLQKLYERARVVSVDRDDTADLKPDICELSVNQ